MSEEREVYRVANTEHQKNYDDMKSMDEIIDYYGIDKNKGCYKDFKDPAIANAVDDIVRIINSYEKKPDSQDDYRLLKMKNALHSLTEVDKKLK